VETVGSLQEANTHNEWLYLKPLVRKQTSNQKYMLAWEEYRDFGNTLKKLAIVLSEG